MFKNKKNIMIVSSVAIIIIFSLLLITTLKPTKENDINVIDVISPESVEDTNGVAGIGNRLSEFDLDGDKEDAPDLDFKTVSVESDKKTDGEGTEQAEYIGRQPPEGYIEPTYLDYYSEEQRENKAYMEYEKEYWSDHIALKDAFQSNIIIIFDDFYPEAFKGYEWFKYSEENNSNDLMWISYAILTYYDGNVPYDYYIIPDDIYNKFYDKAFPNNSMYRIFDVQTHGERPLHINIDTFNYKIRVEEGIQRKNPNCGQGCCD